LFNDSSWLDKKAPLWFIMLPTGHEGPYSLETLERRLVENKLRPEAQIWREGLPVSVTLQDVLTELAALDEELPPPLPPLPEDDLPEIPFSADDEDTPVVRAVNRTPYIVGAFLVILTCFGLYQWMKDQEKFEIRRYPKMSLETHKKIETNLKFEGFEKKIFFHEFSSPDLTHIWLVTTGYQKCDVETVFRSVKDRLLTMADEDVEFVSRGKLSHHVTELNIFEFRKGNKIIPGLYEMDVKASRCDWDVLVAKIMNLFSSP
jgi:hypothetical protein